MSANELRLGNIVTINNIFSHEKMLNIPLLVCGIEKLRENEGGIIKLNYPNYNDNIVIPAFSQFDKFINPIPLTEEWILKAGFIKYYKNQNEYYKKVYVDDDLNYDGRVRYLYIYANLDDKKEPYFCLIFDISNENCEPDYNGISNMKTYEYVHELQNLYFALTGSELVFSTEP